MNTSSRIFRAGRHVQRMAPPRDAFHDHEKYDEPTGCPDCGAVYTGGRWTWAERPEDAYERRCPACQRIEDDLPAGYVTLKGAFAREHRAEILAMVRGCEERERREHPLQRIMRIADVAGGIEVTTTASRLARGITHALHQAYKGRTNLRFARDENLLRAVWERA